MPSTGIALTYITYTFCPSLPELILTSIKIAIYKVNVKQLSR